MEIRRRPGDLILVSCEHGGNRVPHRYQRFFDGMGSLLRSHRGYDAGALRFARELAATLEAPLVASTVTRLLVDLNRSRHHPRLYSEATRMAPQALREEILGACYLPYRTRAETWIARAVTDGARVIHISCHSFTPEMDGKIRHTDIGLLYDPARQAEAELCRALRDGMAMRAPALKVRMNYPYRGTADGFTVHLRRRFSGQAYLGIEIEINQKHVRAGTTHWTEVRTALLDVLRTVLPVGDTARNRNASMPQEVPAH